MTEFACKTCNKILYKKTIASNWSGNCRSCAAKIAEAKPGLSKICEQTKEESPS